MVLGYGPLCIQHRVLAMDTIYYALCLHSEQTTVVFLWL